MRYHGNSRPYGREYCPSGKNVWETEDIAEKAMLASIRKFRAFDFLNVYECKYCGMWHVGRGKLYGKKH